MSQTRLRLQLWFQFAYTIRLSEEFPAVSWAVDEELESRTVCAACTARTYLHECAYIRHFNSIVGKEKTS